MGVKGLLKHVTLLNILLLAVVFLFLYYFLLPRLNGKVRFAPPPIKKVAEEQTVKSGLEQAKPPSPIEFTIIAEQNIFHPERKIPAEKKEEKPLPKPEFVLYGTILSGQQNLAYMEDKKSPVVTPGRERRQMVLKKGDSLSGYALREIEKDKVVMVKGEERMVVRLNDPQNPKARDLADSQKKAPGPQPGQRPGTTAPAKPSPSVEPGPMPAQPPTFRPSLPTGRPAAPSRFPSRRPMQIAPPAGGVPQPSAPLSGSLPE